ncbi:potassium transporter [Spirochaetia bacterium]|nr:potassium transporter [Spirochaetia bacterium]
MKINTFFRKSDALYLLAFFLVLIALGTALLRLPAASERALSLMDAVFTAASAVCVTGMGIVGLDTFSRFGQIIILLLIQIGGLGIISFSSILLSIPGHRLAIRQRNWILEFSINGIEYNPRRIVGNILLLTLCFEAAGAALLSCMFYRSGFEDWAFWGIFHAVTAFCNAGLSPFQPEYPAAQPAILIILMILTIAGGLGFIVLQDAAQVILRKKPRLSYHSRVVLLMSAALIFGGALIFFIFERNRLYGEMSGPLAALNTLFQSVVCRSSGFALTPQKMLSQPSRMLTGILMLVGGAPGSIAGGLKVTTIFVICIVMIRKPDKYGDIKIFHHRLTSDTINRAVVYFLKAVALLVICVTALFITEGRGSPLGEPLTGNNAEAIVFEVLGAFSTAGITLGLTPDLSTAGKLVILAAMFAGRVGLIALAFPAIGHKNYDVTYPEGSVLLG